MHREKRMPISHIYHREFKGEVFNVEEIRAKKMLRGQWHYEVKWEGWEGTTWEPAKKFAHLSIVKKFEVKWMKEARRQENAKKARQAKSFYFDKHVSKGVRTQLEQFGPLEADSVNRLVSQGTRVQDVLGMDKETGDIFIRYMDASYERVPMLTLQTFENEKLTDFLTAQLWEMKG